MFHPRKLCTLAAGLLLAVVAQAQTVQLSNAYARATVTGIQNGAAWLTMTNTGPQADRLIGASSDIAGHTEIHDMKMEGDVMKMFKIDGVAIPAGQSLTLGEGNKLHIMLMGLKQPLSQGQSFTLNMQFEHAGTIPVQVQVRDAKAQPGHKNAQGHSSHSSHHGQPSQRNGH